MGYMLRRRSSVQQQVLAIRVFGAFFGLFALVFFCAMFLRNLPRALRSGSWPATPCVIESSRVAATDDRRGGITYGVAVKYDYEFAGRPYSSDRYGLVRSYDGDEAGKKLIVHRLKPGSASVCYVDPSDPTMAVLDRSMGGTIAVGCITGGLLVIGLLIFFGGPRVVRRYG